jgi:uncharacterized protein (DUF58 family)
MEYVGEIAAALSFVILNAGDSVGFALFTDEIVKKMPPSQGLIQYHNLTRALVTPRYYGGKYDLNEALKFILAFLKEASIVIIISDFIGLKSGWEKYIKMVSKKFDLISIMVKDPRDKTLPDYNGQVILEDPFSNKQILVRPDVVGEAYRNYVTKQEQMIKNTLLNAGADFIELTTNESFVKPITNLFIKRTKRIR